MPCRRLPGRQSGRWGCRPERAGLGDGAPTLCCWREPEPLRRRGGGREALGLRWRPRVRRAPGRAVVPRPCCRCLSGARPGCSGSAALPWLARSASPGSSGPPGLSGSTGWAVVWDGRLLRLQVLVQGCLHRPCRGASCLPGALAVGRRVASRAEGSVSSGLWPGWQSSGGSRPLVRGRICAGEHLGAAAPGPRGAAASPRVTGATSSGSHCGHRARGGFCPSALLC